MSHYNEYVPAHEEKFNENEIIERNKNSNCEMTCL